MSWKSILASPEPGVNENRKASIVFGMLKCPASRLSNRFHKFGYLFLRRVYKCMARTDCDVGAPLVGAQVRNKARSASPNGR